MKTKKRRSEDSRKSVVMVSPHHLQLPDKLLAFSEDLARAATCDDISASVARHVPRLIDGYACLVEPFTSLQTLFHDRGFAKAAFIPLGDAGGLVLAERRADREFTPEDWHMLRSLARQVQLAQERVHTFEKVRELSLTDPLTGVGNRRRLDVYLEHAMAAARRGEPLTVILVDLDGFKAVNDREGHLQGDHILRTVAHTLQEQVRGSDIVVRYGGDEFLMVLHGTHDGAENIVERVRETLGGMISFSVGIVEYHSSIESGEQLVDLADRQLYTHKAVA